MSKHTPGPWTIEADPEKAGLHPLHDNRYIASERGWVCALRDQPAQAADARLIAAAPDLLHALKWAAEYVSLYTGDGAGWTGVQQGRDRDRFIDDNGFCPERLRAFIETVIVNAEEGE
tara:strand:+ start:836 stop:1189 length:354 start_codon:yes stop_codon:yes gene_type:complete